MKMRNGLAMYWRNGEAYVAIGLKIWPMKGEKPEM